MMGTFDKIQDQLGDAAKACDEGAIFLKALDTAEANAHHLAAVAYALLALVMIEMTRARKDGMLIADADHDPLPRQPACGT